MSNKNHIFVLLLSTLSALLRNKDRFDDDDDAFAVGTMVTFVSPLGSDRSIGEGGR